MIDIATGFSIEPPTAWIRRNAINHPSEGARLHSSEPSENVATRAGRSGADRTGRPATPKASAGMRSPACRHRSPLQPAHRCVKRALDRRQSDVDDRRIDAGDGNAQTARSQHRVATTRIEAGTRRHADRCHKHCCITITECCRLHDLDAGFQVPIRPIDQRYQELASLITAYRPGFPPSADPHPCALAYRRPIPPSVPDAEALAAGSSPTRLLLCRMRGDGSTAGS